MREIFRFIQRYFFAITFIFYELLSIVLLIYNNDFQRSFANSIFMKAEGGMFNAIANFKEYCNLSTVNKNLMDENARLRKMLASSYRNHAIDTMMIYYIEQNYKSDKDITSSNPNIFQFIPANVIYNSTNYRDNKILIDKGALDGIREGMGVISGTSVIGTIINVSSHYSSIMPVLHSNFRIGVKPSNINEFGFASWDGKDINIGTVSDIPAHTLLRNNDTITTSGKSKKFPPNIPVGLVYEIENETGTGVYNIKIKFIDDYRSISSVYVVDHIYSHEIDSLML